jgi:hypothetical protein
MKTRNLTIVFIILVIILAGMGYWYFFMGGDKIITGETNDDSTSQGFQPFGRDITPPTSTTTNNQNNDNVFPVSTSTTKVKIPVLRLLSETPVGGYGASTTATSTVFRWIDRGRGNIYEAKNTDLDVITLSNTIIPMVYDSAWNRNLTAFIGMLYDKETSSAPAIFAELKNRNITVSSTTNQNGSITPFELKGKNLPENTIAFTVSPKKDRIFIVVKESGKGIGYISGFNGSNATKIFETPITQLNVEWPEENTIAITTKANSSLPGYLYFVNPKNGSWKKVAGPIFGMSTKTSNDAKRVFISGTASNGGLSSYILNTTTGESKDSVIRTLAEKCAWGNFDKEMLYCAVPSTINNSDYPDEWYKGTVSFVDRIWQINTDTEEVNMVSQIINQSDRVIDAIDLSTDEKDNYLLFVNKNDLSLWSLELGSRN